MERDLFGLTKQFPEGFRYEEDFLTRAEETSLLDELSKLQFQNATYKEYSARRRIVSFGGRYDFTENELLPGSPIPDWLFPLRERAAAWADLSAADIDHALVSEYAVGTALGWHRDVPDFEAIVGVSLGGVCRMRFRRYPPLKPGRAEFTLDLAPRSIYTMQGLARWGWQHSVSPTKMLRYSITFRTLRSRAVTRGSRGKRVADEDTNTERRDPSLVLG